MLSSKLTVGVHILTLLTLESKEPLTSEYIAGSVNTNPVVIRRLLGLLREAGYVESRGGVGGGWLLKGNPDQITLFDVLRAVDPQGDAFSLHKSEPNPECPVGRHIQGVLSEVYDEASRAMEGRLAKTSISGILGSVQKRMGP